MGKMILDDLRKRLERLDEDADLMIDNNARYKMVIAGGSAFILLGKLTRATHDIDALSVPKVSGRSAPYTPGRSTPSVSMSFVSRI